MCFICQQKLFDFFSVVKMKKDSIFNFVEYLGQKVSSSTILENFDCKNFV